MKINNVVVIGSGTMGSGIAAQLCNANIPVTLLDLKTEISQKAKERIEKSRPPLLIDKSKIDGIKVGNISDDFNIVSEADWIVEAVVERIDIKHDIYKKIFKSYYVLISENKESVEINFKSQLNNNNYKDLIKDSLERDLIFQFTTQGPHKDDLELLLNGYQIKKFGSQGQQKSLLLSLKLAQYEFLKKKLDIKPIVLLDDIFDKLDQKRVELIMQLIEEKYFGQIFITDTDKKRVSNAIETTNLSYKIHEIF